MKKSKYYSLTELTKVLGADYKTLNKAIDAGAIPYIEAPVTRKKLFSREVINGMYLKEALQTSAV